MQNSFFKSIISVILCISMLFSFASYFVVNAATQLGYITESYVNVRTSPSTTPGVANIKKDDSSDNANKYVMLNYGHDVTIIEKITSPDDTKYAEWYHIKFKYNNKDLEGYVYSGFVEIKTTTDDYVMPDGVPEIYKEYIENLLSLHPNWNFVFYDTGINWSDLFTDTAQGYFGRSMIQSNQPLSYRSTASGAYDWRNDKWLLYRNEAGWYQANTQTIAYYMDPRNFLNESNVFMFEALSYDSETQTIDGVEKILSGSFMDGVNINNTDNSSISYAQAYIDAAKIADVSPYHLASRTIQEVGKNGSGSTSGNYSETYKGLYNFYNIGASASGDPIANGLKYASGSTSTNANKEKYLLPWDTQYKSIVGGAKWISSGYIDNNQDTLYFQKFNVINKVWSHQYMTNIMAPYSESFSIKKTYSNLGILDSSFTFIIPFYRNMPAEACKLPEASYDNPNNWLSSLKVEGYDLAFDSGKTSGYSLTVASSVSSVKVTATTVNSNAKVSGTGTVSLNSGSNAVDIVVTAQNGDTRTYTINIIRNADNIIPLKSISLNSSTASMFTGDTKKLTVTYNPSNTTDSKAITWTTSDQSVATVSNGTITAIGVGTATITAKVGAFSATCKVTVSSSTNYTLGDIDADGAVTIADALMVFKYKSLEIKLSDTQLKAADTDKNGEVELADALRIFKFKSGEIENL